MKIEEIRWTHRDENFKEIFSLNISFPHAFENYEIFSFRMRIMWDTMQEAVRKLDGLEK